MSEQKKVGFCPINDRVLVKRIVLGEEKTPGGIVIPGDKKPTKMADVLATGPKVDVINVGDVVFMPDFAGTAIEVDGEEMTVINQDDILGIKE